MIKIIHINIDYTQKRSYAKQIYKQIRKMILGSEIGADDALPSTREVSKELNISRNTVLVAYDMLVAEGLARSVPRSGVFVNDGIQMKKNPEQVQSNMTASLADYTMPDSVINFDSGLAALELFPKSKWNRTVSKAFLDAPTSALGYDDPQGRLELRHVLCSYLKKTRGIKCTPEQIMITSGTKQGLTLIAKCLLHAESKVWIENPTNRNVLKIFSYHTNHIVPFDVDEDGIQPSMFPKDEKPDVIFVTPSHQFPMGGILPMKRRIELIAFAQKTGCYIVEDDYDSEFRYNGLPSSSLFELDNEHVIYAGTFSKILYPSLRLGYLVVPEGIVDSLREIKRLSDHHSNSIYQLALMRFIENGDLERHIRRMKKEYLKRRNQMIEILHSLFQDKVQILGEQAGMHIVAKFEDVSFSESIMCALRNNGLYIVPVSQHCHNDNLNNNCIILGYAQLQHDQMLAGLTLLKSVIEI